MGILGKHFHPKVTRPEENKGLAMANVVHNL